MRAVLFWLVSMLLAAPLKAAECDMAFAHGIVISPDHIRIMQNNRAHVQISGEHQLFIRGEWIMLSDEEAALLAQYSHGLRKFVPEIVSIAVDGVELGMSGIEAMFAGIGSSAQQAEWRELVRETTFQWMSRFVRTNEHFYLAPQSLNELDYFLHGELKPQLDNLARHTVGAVWGALREALRHSDNNFERGDNQEWQAMGNLVEKINSGLDAKAVELEEKSALFCQRMQELDEIEQQLQQRLPALKDYDVVTQKDAL